MQYRVHYRLKPLCSLPNDNMKINSTKRLSSFRSSIAFLPHMAHQFLSTEADHLYVLYVVTYQATIVTEMELKLVIHTGDTYLDLELELGRSGQV